MIDKTRDWNIRCAVMSWIWPGMGQVFKKHYLRGILWFTLAIVFTVFIAKGHKLLILPGIVLLILCVVDAYRIPIQGKVKQEEKIEKKKERYDLPAFLSFLVPGLGQLIKGQVVRGILLFFGTLIGYSLWYIPGIIIHIYGIYDAYTKKKEK